MLWFALWINALAWFVGISWYVQDLSSSSNDEMGHAFGAFAITGVLWAGLLGLFSVSEDQTISPRQARTITQAPRWRKWATLLHGPGSARGRLAFIAMAILSLGVGALGITLGNGSDYIVRMFIAAWILVCYLAALFVVGI